MIQWLVGQAGVGGLAAFALIMLRQSYETRIRDLQQMLNESKATSDRLINALTENTESHTKLSSAVASLEHIVGNCVYAQEGQRVGKREGRP